MFVGTCFKSSRWTRGTLVGENPVNEAVKRVWLPDSTIILSLFQKQRCMQALDLLRGDGVDVLLLFPGANIAYYTGFPIGMSERLAAAVIPVDGEPYFVVNKLEGELRGLDP